MTANKTAMTTQEVAARFNELARQEKWFEIQDEFFADNVKSIDLPILLTLVMQKANLPFAKKEKTL